MFDRLVDLVHRDLQIARDGLVVVLFQVVEVRVDDGKFEIVVAVDLGLHVHALLKRARADTHRVPLLHLSQDAFGVLSIDGDFSG